MHYLTEEKIQQLKKEFEELKKKKRDIANRLEEARALGDLSENVEYAEVKEEQAFNEGRIREIEQILKGAVIISKSRKDIVQVGSKIKVKSDSGVREFVIVGSQEAQPSEGKISNESPLGRAFLGHKAGETIEAIAPKGRMKYKIVEIS